MPENDETDQSVTDKPATYTYSAVSWPEAFQTGVRWAGGAVIVYVLARYAPGFFA